VTGISLLLLAGFPLLSPAVRGRELPAAGDNSGAALGAGLLGCGVIGLPLGVVCSLPSELGGNGAPEPGGNGFATIGLRSAIGDRRTSGLDGLALKEEASPGLAAASACVQAAARLFVSAVGGGRLGTGFASSE